MAAVVRIGTPRMNLQSGQWKNAEACCDDDRQVIVGGDDGERARVSARSVQQANRDQIEGKWHPNQSAEREVGSSYRADVKWMDCKTGECQARHDAVDRQLAPERPRNANHINGDPGECEEGEGAGDLTRTIDDKRSALAFCWQRVPIGPHETEQIEVARQLRQQGRTCRIVRFLSHGIILYLARYAPTFPGQTTQTKRG